MKQRAKGGPVLAAGMVFAVLAATAMSPQDAQSRSLSYRAEPLFEANVGQLDASVLYRGRFGSLEAAIRQDGAVSLAFRSRAGAPPVTISPAHALSPASVDALEPAAFRTNYFRGGAAPSSFTDVPHYGRVRLRGIYEGVDLAYHASTERLEFDFVVAPGADPAVIALAVAGATAVHIDADGDLAIEAGSEILRQRKPVAYQFRDGAQVAVPCAYRLVDSTTVALEVGAYDRSRELVIDPVVDYSSYFGGSNSDAVMGVQIGADGSIYVAGGTTSTNFPVVAAYQSTFKGVQDVFVAKVSAVTGKAVYSTYIGGRNGDSGVALAVDGAGSVYVTGGAGSAYPTTSGAYSTSSKQISGFITKLSPAGNSLVYSTLVPATIPSAIIVDGQNRAVITGGAGSAFATTVGTVQPGYGGGGLAYNGDAFVFMLNTAGSAPVFATFFGGSSNDYGSGIAFDSAGRIAIAGGTSSVNLPISGAYQPTLKGTKDGFIAVMSADGRTLVSSTYYGGSDSDEINGLAADAFGNLVVVGNTLSNDLPVPNALLPYSSLAIIYIYEFTNLPAYEKGFVAKFGQSSPLTLRWATFVGGTIDCCDEANGVAVDPAGDIYVVGSSRVDRNDRFSDLFPYLPRFLLRSRYGGAVNLPDRWPQATFVAGYLRDGRALRFQTYIAPCALDSECQPAVIASRGVGQVIAGGSTFSSWLPVTAPTTQAASGSPDVNTDGFALTLTVESPQLTLAASDPSPVAASPITLTATSFGAGGAGAITFLDDTATLGTASLVEGVAKLDVTLPAGVRRLAARLGGVTSPVLLLPVTVLGSTTP